MVQIDLLVVIGFYIFSFAVSGHQKHVQQGGAAVEVKLSGRYFVQSRIRRFAVRISGGSDEDKHILQAYFLVEQVKQVGDAAVEAYISVLYFHGTLLYGLVRIVACIISKCQ